MAKDEEDIGQAAGEDHERGFKAKTVEALNLQTTNALKYLQAKSAQQRGENIVDKDFVQQTKSFSL